MSKYPEYKGLNLPQIGKEILNWWEKEKIFEKSVSSREGKTPFVFYEGPPSANGMPGIHHVMARAIKDIFCRYQTLKGKQVKRKAGWDTHGLPIELAVEKTLGITKEDIGKKISIEDYNKECRREVMKFQDKWEEVTRIMGYWVDMKHPYVTYENNYIESVWWLLKELYKKNLLYKGYTIQPYSPAAGTGLSTHELNQPGCYRNVKDRTATAMFKVKHDVKSEFLFQDIKENIYFLAWTTTPWTLPANMALAVGKNIEYALIKTYNPFSLLPIVVIMSLELLPQYFKSENRLALQNWEEKKPEKKNIPWAIIKSFKGSDLKDIHYEQLLPYVNRENWNDVAFRVILGDFVSTEDGTGIVHIAPTFGADDMRAANAAGISQMFVQYDNKGFGPIVDQRGRYRPEITDFANEYVKAEYLTESEKSKEIDRLLNLGGSPLNDLVSKIVHRTNEYLSVDERIVLKLELEGKLYKKETYEHSYPHCWRTDKPILYYPLDSWFVKTTAAKDKMVELNKTINWKPAHTGTGRFGEWLNNLQDWNLSRSRFWGIPLPIWQEPFSQMRVCVGAFEEFKNTKCSYYDEQWRQEIHGVWFYKGEQYKELEKQILNKDPQIIQKIESFNKSFPLKLIDIKALLDNTQQNPNNILWNLHKDFLIPYLDTVPEGMDFHKPYIDNIVFIAETNTPSKVFIRESDLIDVWFDSGAMPYAQLHYPFENGDQIDQRKYFPADFIAEGVDQTRGWFYTLHAIAAMLFDSVAYKNVVSNGLVLDKNGNKMSKRLGNAVDPFETINKYGADATRWYMITNASPWDNLKFDIDGIGEVQRKFFGTLYNTYSFFSLYANIDNFTYKEKEIPVSERPEIDRWILSELNSLIKVVDESFNDYEPTKAGRALEYFVDEHLSNWYVRLCRRRFWKGDYTQDKISAYQTLYKCLEVVAQLSSPIAPFFFEKLFKDLNDITKKQNTESVHLSLFPKVDESAIDKSLEERMELAQKISSMILSIRKKENIRVRQPLNKIQIPVLDNSFKQKVEAVKDLILSEVNVKEIEFVDESKTQIVKNLKLNFKTLGKKLGKDMKAVQQFATENLQAIISSIEKTGKYDLNINSSNYTLETEDVEIIPVDIPGWKVANAGQITVALDITITEKLKEEGIAREIVNRLQNLRKEKNFEVTDRIDIRMKNHPKIKSAVLNNLDYIRAEILANTFEIVNEINGNGVEIKVDDEIKTMVSIDRIKQLN